MVAPATGLPNASITRPVTETTGSSAGGAGATGGGAPAVGSWALALPAHASTVNKIEQRGNMVVFPRSR
jgi:hypothetical protein